MTEAGMTAGSNHQQLAAAWDEFSDQLRSMAARVAESDDAGET